VGGLFDKPPPWGKNAAGRGGFQPVLSIGGESDSILDAFSKHTGGVDYRTWAGKHVSGAGFEKAFAEAMDRATVIHFNMRDFNEARALAYKGGPTYGNITNWEYQQLMKNPRWAAKTRRYFNW
jgi:hypothetical protein